MIVLNVDKRDYGNLQFVNRLVPLLAPVFPPFPHIDRPYDDYDYFFILCLKKY